MTISLYIFSIGLLLSHACGSTDRPQGRLPQPYASDAMTQTSTSPPDGGATDAGFDPCPTPDLSSIREKTFIPSCGQSGCHTGTASTAAGLDLTLDVEALRIRLRQSSTQSASRLKLVEPRYIGSSWLYLKLFFSPPPTGEQMPLRGEIQACELKAISDWIAAGGAL